MNKRTREPDSASKEPSQPVKRPPRPSPGPIDHYEVFRLDDSGGATFLTQLPGAVGGIGGVNVAREIRRQFQEDETYLVSYQPKNAAGKYCGKAVVTEIIGRDEMMGEVEGDSLPIETVDGRMVMDLKDVTKLVHAMRNGQPTEAAAPPQTGGIDAAMIKSMGESFQAVMGVQGSLLASVTQSLKAVAESRPTTSPTAAPVVTDAEAIRAQTENELLKHALSSGDNPMAVRVIDAILGEKTNPSEGPWYKVLFETALEKLGPTAVQIGMAYLASRAGAQGIPQGERPGAPGQLPAPMPPQPAADPSEAMLAQVVQQIHFALAQGQSVYGVEDTIERLIAGFPDSRAAQVAQMIVTQPVEEVVKQLGLTQPNAVTWVKTLQDDWAQEQENAREAGQDQPEILTFGAGSEG